MILFRIALYILFTFIARLPLDCQLEDVSSSSTMIANGWVLSYEMTPSKDPSFQHTCSASQNSQITETWYGYSNKAIIGSVSKQLKGKGSGKLIYSNCFEEGKENPSNKVIVYLNGVQISNAKSGEIKKIDFDYDDNDVIKLEEEYGIIKLHQIGLNCARKMSIIL